MCARACVCACVRACVCVFVCVQNERKVAVGGRGGAYETEGTWALLNCIHFVMYLNWKQSPRNKKAYLL